MNERIKDCFLENNILVIRNKLYEKIKTGYDVNTICKLAESLITLSYIHGNDQIFTEHVQHCLRKLNKI